MGLCPDAVDNCPFVSNPDQVDADRDGAGTVCATATIVILP